jgi:D-alanine-D-alanine ligase-like ATP-grasp enzyme
MGHKNPKKIAERRKKKNSIEKQLKTPVVHMFPVKSSNEGASVGVSRQELQELYEAQQEQENTVVAEEVGNKPYLVKDIGGNSFPVNYRKIKDDRW